MVVPWCAVSSVVSDVLHAATPTESACAKRRLLIIEAHPGPCHPRVRRVPERADVLGGRVEESVARRCGSVGGQGSRRIGSWCFEVEAGSELSIVQRIANSEVREPNVLVEAVIVIEER